MSNTIEELEKELEQVVGAELSNNAASDINAALLVADFLESKGFSFKLKDLCPRSLDETKWQAVFTKNESTYMAEDSQSAIAVCHAAIETFRG